MKLIYNDQCYLQKFDIAFLLHNIVVLPRSFKKECEKWANDLRIRNTRDHFTFIGPFVNPETIAWIDSLDYIIRYDDYARTPIKALNKRIRTQTREAKIYEETARAMRCEYANNMIQDHLRATKQQARKAQQELAALEIMRDHLEHKIEFEFPEDYTPPAPPEPKKDRFIDRLIGHYRIP